jgi:CarD family transcriptional regulator
MSDPATQTQTPAKLDELSVGSHVFYPAHGVAEVTGIETRTVGDEQPEFYVLELATGGKLLLPTATVEQSGVRQLISKADASKLVDLVTVEPEADDGPWRERSAVYADALRDGSPDGYTQTLRQLLFRSRSSKLTTTERRQLDAARGYFVAEVSVVLGKPAEDIEERLLAISDAE